MNDKSFRVGLVASAYQGEAILHEFLTNPVLEQYAEVVGVIRDDPNNPVCNATKRTWQFWDRVELPVRIERLARKRGIPTYTGDVKDLDFQETFIEDWQPDLILCCVFGQRIPTLLRATARYGAVNFHPCVASPFEVWPSEFQGPLPLKRMIEARHPDAHWAAHFMTDQLDAGPPIAFSRPMSINAELSLAEVHESHSPQIAVFAVDVATVLLRLRTPRDVKPPRGNADFGPLTDWTNIQKLNPIQNRELNTYARRVGEKPLQAGCLQCGGYCENVSH